MELEGLIRCRRKVLMCVKVHREKKTPRKDQLLKDKTSH